MPPLRFTRRGFLVGLTTAAVFAVFDNPVEAGPVNTDSEGVAIEGYDPVAYFKSGKPVRGSGKFTAKHNGATWRFSSAANRDAFAKSPGAFAPQFGGHCAWAVSRGYTASIDPRAWKVVGGKLYLNYSIGVQRQWSADIPGNIAKGNANWPGLKGKL